MKRIVFFIALVLLSFSFAPIKKLSPYIFEALFRFPNKIENTENPITVKGANLGKLLFYDTILSQDYSMSCASCHKQEFAFADNVNFSQGIDSSLMTRNTMPLFNLAWYSSFFWDGRSSSIEDQVFVPVAAHNEMNLSWKEAAKRLNGNNLYQKEFKKVFGVSKIDSTHIAKAIAQFERTLISNQSKYDRVIQGKDKFTAAELNGFIIVNDQSMGDCLHCHITDAHALGTNGKFANNGLDSDYTLTDKGKFGFSKNEKDIGKFKIPSLRNIALTAPYMHDGRFETLEEVLDFYSEGVQSSKYIDSKMQYAHQGGVQLSDKDKKDVIAFLKTLTDSVFIQNPEFLSPY